MNRKRFVVVALAFAVVFGAVKSLSQESVRPQWEYGIYSERTEGNEQRYEWQSKGLTLLTKKRTELLEKMGYKPAEGEEAMFPLVKMLDFFGANGWEMVQVSPDSPYATMRYYFRRPVLSQS
ncbi:MAG TPA: hypothetical protein PKH07_03130 [bacterium]|nr:hypothetical protein [bacterium]